MQAELADRERDQTLAQFMAVLAYYISERYPSYREKLSASVAKARACGELVLAITVIALNLRDFVKLIKFMVRHEWRNIQNVYF